MRRAILSLFCVMGSLMAVCAQPGADPAALTALRLRYQTLLAEAEAPPRARWAAALEGQEKHRVAAGDFVGASLLRERRMALLSAKAAAPSVRQAVELSPGMARTSTGVEFLDAKKAVARFRRTGAMMEWELPGQTPGTYQVNLVCGVMGTDDQSNLPDPYKDPAVPLLVRPPGSVLDGMAGGVVEFRKLTSLKEGGTLLRGSVRSTGGWANERTLPLGMVDLDSKIVTFSLRAVESMPAGVMDFRRIELVRSGAANGVGADPGGIRELVRLQEVYQKEFAEQTRSITGKYLKALGELEVSSVKNKDNDTLALVRQEKQGLGQGEEAAHAGPAKATARVLPVTEKLYMLVKGEARLTSQGDYLTRMRPAGGCEVTWKLAGLGVASGTYDVEVECRLTPGHGGTAVLSATTPGGSPGPPMNLRVAAPGFVPGAVITKRKPDGTPGTSLTSIFKAGRVTIPKGSEYLKLEVTSLIVPDGALCDLKALRLIPAEATSP